MTHHQPMIQPTVRRHRYGLFVRAAVAPILTFALLSVACRSKPKPGEAAPAASASARHSAPLTVRCREASGSEVVLLGTGEPPKVEIEDEEQAEELPFSVELGSARAGAKRFGVAGLESRRGATFAFAAVVSPDGTGQSVELLRVFGDPEPPAVAPIDEGFLLLAASSDAAGPTLRLMRLDPPFSAKDLRRGEEVTGLRRDLAGVALETSGGRALLAFGKLEKNVGRLAVAALDPNRLALLGAPRALELPEGLEAEAPELIARDGGFYLAFLGSRARARPSGPVEEGPVLEAGPVGLFVIPLDEQGVPTGAPRELSPPGAQLSAFQISRFDGARAMALYREEPEGPGLDRPSVEAVLFGIDGSLERRTWELGDSTGVPALLIDPAPPKGAPGGWVFVHGEAEVRVGPLAEAPLSLPALVSEPMLRSADPAALLDGRILRARSRGTRAELDLVSCSLVAQ